MDRLPGRGVRSLTWGTIPEGGTSDTACGDRLTLRARVAVASDRMRLLLDENLSPASSRFLIEAGHDVVHVRDRGLTSATDDVVLALAAAEGRVLISADTDFGTLLARSGAIEPSVVLIRRAVGRRAAQQARLPIANLPVVQDELVEGSVVVLGERTIRIRLLPI